MTKKEFFSLPFEKKCQFICTVRHRLYLADTKKERDAAIPNWLIEMVEEFEERYKFRKFAALFLGSLLMMKGSEDNEEVVCILEEIHDDRLHLTILELDQLIGLSWTRLSEEKDEDDCH